MRQGGADSNSLKEKRRLRTRIFFVYLSPIPSYVCESERLILCPSFSLSIQIDRYRERGEKNRERERERVGRFLFQYGGDVMKEKK